MTSIALIAEGATDQAVIENILYGYLDDDDLEVNPLLPLRDETDKHRIENFSNWLLVFEYCRSEKLKQALQLNDYVIVQIDTDVSEDSGFGVAKLEAGRELAPDELVEKVCQRLIAEMGEEIYIQIASRIIFAVCVHSLECWLLPLHAQKNHHNKTKGCLQTLERALKTNVSKNARFYDDLSRPYLKRKNLMRLGTKNPSLNRFVLNLDAVFSEEN
jgi:hypothetical protein